MKPNGLNKYDKLCSSTAIDQLFSRGADDLTKSVMAYPLRAVWRENDRRTVGSAIQFLISIPKKRVRHAVDRVTMRRRVREAYRLNRNNYLLSSSSKRIDLAFIYVANELKDFHSVERAVIKILQRIRDDKGFEQSDGMAD